VFSEAKACGTGCYPHTAFSVSKVCMALVWCAVTRKGDIVRCRHQRIKAHALSDAHRAEGGHNQRACSPRHARWPWQHRNLL